MVFGASRNWAEQAALVCWKSPQATGIYIFPFPTFAPLIRPKYQLRKISSFRGIKNSFYTVCRVPCVQFSHHQFQLPFPVSFRMLQSGCIQESFLLSSVIKISTLTANIYSLLEFIAILFFKHEYLQISFIPKK